MQLNHIIKKVSYNIFLGYAAINIFFAFKYFDWILSFPLDFDLKLFSKLTLIRLREKISKNYIKYFLHRSQTNDNCVLKITLYALISLFMNVFSSGWSPYQFTQLINQFPCLFHHCPNNDCAIGISCLKRKYFVDLEWFAIMLKAKVMKYRVW